MANAKAKLERQLYGPSVTEVAVGAGLSLVLGALLAVAYLVWKPVETVSTLPEEPASDMVYYQPGSNNAGKGRQYLRKRQLLLEGGAAETVSLSEDELNAWITSSRARPDATEVSGVLAPQSINFRVRDGVFQVGIPSTFQLFGLNRPLIVQARGGFAPRDGHFAFSPDELYVGSLPAHRLPGLSGVLLSRFLDDQNVPEELAQAWRKLDRIEVVEDQLVLALP